MLTPPVLLGRIAIRPLVLLGRTVRAYCYTPLYYWSVLLGRIAIRPCIIGAYCWGVLLYALVFSWRIAPQAQAPRYALKEVRESRFIIFGESHIDMNLFICYIAGVFLIFLYYLGNSQLRKLTFFIR